MFEDPDEAELLGPVITTMRRCAAGALGHRSLSLAPMTNTSN